ncbi:acyltransferase family protein [Catellatospora sp. NPDC049609]|uniref:acyltransferase family protein n=1 Tax=Catellatospora sp. NPDC049609 TaxID=3155505 RepID=UPI003447ADCE
MSQATLLAPADGQTETPRRYRTGFRPDVEGLRAVAVGAVLLFHAAVPGFSGGYVGVDVFFVISGFLITGLLLGDIEKRGTFSLKDFYARRARRILPAAGVVLAATSVGAAFLLSPLRRQDVATDVITSALNVANWRFIGLQTDYLAEGRAQSPLLHFWSLAVEEQFYLVWAPLALVLVLVARKLRRSPLPILAVAIGAITAGSFAVSLYWTSTNLSLAYLSTPSRAWQFGAGALGALAVPHVARALRAGAAGRRQGYALGVAGAAAVLWSVYAYSADTPFPGTAALLPTLGTVAILLAGLAITPEHGPAGVARLLATAPARAVGRLSYAWYLWHWPVLVLWEAHFGEQHWPAKLALTLASGVPAWLTMRLVEGPIRLSPRVTAAPWRGLTVGLLAVLIPVTAGVVLDRSAGATAATAEGWKLRPSPQEARHDSPVANKTCMAREDTTTNGTCLFGDPASDTRVVLFGDSHALQWFPALEQIGRSHGWAVEVLGKSSCPVPVVAISIANQPKANESCVAWRNNTVDRILKGPKPKFIMVGTLMKKASVGKPYVDAWDDTLTRLAASGAPIVYLRDTPYPNKDVPECVSGIAPGSTACDFKHDPGVLPDAMADLIRDGKRPGVHLLDFTADLCPLERCPVVIGDLLVYHDQSHISATAARDYAPRMEAQLRAYGLA